MLRFSVIWSVLNSQKFDLQQTIETLLESGYSLIEEQKLVMETKLSKEYMKNMDDSWLMEQEKVSISWF